MIAQRTSAALLIFLTAFLYALTPAHASDGWKDFSAKSGLFKLRLPDITNNETTEFHVNDGHLIYTEEVIARIDQRPYKDITRDYIVRAEESFGPPLSFDKRMELINHEMDLLEKQFAGEAGTVVSRETGPYHNYASGEILITYEDENAKEQGIRARLVMGKTSKIQQIITGPKQVMLSQTSNNFFKSLVMLEPPRQTPGIFAKSHTPLTSPLQIFTATLPGVHSPYVKKKPQVKSTDKAELVSLEIFDPMRAQTVFYNIYGYLLDQPQDAGSIKELLIKNQISKNTKDFSNISLTSHPHEKIPVVETLYYIKPPNNHPYLDTVRLRSFYIGPFVIVQEMLGSKTLVETDYMNKLWSLIAFHPEQAHKARQEKSGE